MKVLLVQCCHLPQFFFVAGRVRQKHPEWQLDALVLDHPQVRQVLKGFPVFEAVTFFPKHELGTWNLELGTWSYQRILFPLLTRGYYGIKKAAKSLKARAWEVDYLGELRELEPWRLRKSFFFPLHSPPAEFSEYPKAFPHRLLGSEILVVESCRPSLLQQTAEELGRMFPSEAAVTRVREPSLRKIWPALRGRRFDEAVVFFSGEKGLAGLRLLPFLLRVPRILIVNENGDYFDAGGRTLARFLYNRIRYGAAVPRKPELLLIQSEEESLISKAIRVLQQPHVANQATIRIFCSETKRAFFESLPGVEQVLTYRPGAWFQNASAIWNLFKLRADVIAAVFSGRPIFRAHKMLFFLLPARGRLAVNENLDCFYLTRKNVHKLFRNRNSGLLSSGRLALKFALFLPRFFYLVIWITAMRLKRAYALSRQK
ncbi:MAG: hypothetical protein ACRD1R_08745 [Acidobacteriota bacterium]